MQQEPAASPRASGVIGIQRAGRFLFRLFFDQEDAPQSCVFVAFYPGEAESSTFAAAPTQDPAVSRQLDEAWGRTKAARRKQLNWRKWSDYVFEPAQGRLVRSVRLGAFSAGEIQFFDVLGRLSLDLRIPVCRDEFRDHLTFRRRRSTDDETVFRSALDTVRHHLPSPEMNGVLGAYVVNAYVIATYKGVTLDITDGLKTHRAAIRRLIDKLSSSSSMREDRDVTLLSFLTAQWHYGVHVQDEVLVRQCLVEIEALNRQDRDPHPSFAYNACISLLLYGLLEQVADPKRAIGLMEAVYDRFRSAATRRTYIVSQVEELAVSHAASVLALKLRAALREGQPIMPKMIAAAVELCSRVPDPVFKAKLSELLQGAALAEMRA